MYIDYSFAKVITILGLSKMKAEKMNRGEQVPVSPNRNGDRQIFCQSPLSLCHATCNSHRGCDSRQYADKQLNQPFPCLLFHISSFS